LERRLSSILIKTEVHEGEYEDSPAMVYVGYNLSIADLVSKYEYLKENFGLTMLRLAYAIGFSETTVGNVFNRKSKPNRSTLIALAVGLNKLEEFYESDE